MSSTFGCAYADVAVTDDQKEWSARQWAEHFLWLGGFEASTAGAETTDKDGWLALHHAIQTSVHWSYGIKTSCGIIEMMSIERLQAKTRAGRPAGWTAMHLAANGSDKLRLRAKVVELLLSKRVDANPCRRCARHVSLFADCFGRCRQHKTRTQY